MKSRRGFTLIELLAVIVILGLLMAIAIPSVTRYITESRKKTLTTTVGNYIGALVNEVNDLSYTFTGQNTVYAVPIECISLERGGTNPFGHWYQANDAYFAYILVQYDDVNSKYVYGFTFKDSAGYGLYPITQANINEKGKQIKTGLDLNKPITGDITSLTTLAKWQESGFKVDSSTYLQVLEATSEDEVGNGTTTCTLCQKGDNYAQVEEEKEERNNTLSKLIKKHNTLITAEPTLTTSSNNTSDASGLYLSTATNSGQPTYYFRGNVRNNYVKFAGFDWRIIRINEDGTIRLISQKKIDSYEFNSNFNDNYTYMYYSNSDIAKVELEGWYDTTFVEKKLDKYIAKAQFCEQAKVKYSSDWPDVVGNTEMTYYAEYTPTFKCQSDDNDKGILDLKIGLITYDEVVYAGGYPNIVNNDYYLYGGFAAGNYILMSSAGANNTVNAKARIWYLMNANYMHTTSTRYSSDIRPVINLNANVTATGTGTSTDPYVIQTN